METTEPNGDKSVVERLNFGKMTAKRVSWEAWEFTVTAPFQVRVTNASYGYLKDDHSYLVTIKVDDDGQPVPDTCGCPADQYREEYDCKHKVALAVVGGPLVLHSARAFSPTSGDTTEPADASDTSQSQEVRP